MAYAISFDLNTEQLKSMYPSPSWQNVYLEIKKMLTDLGFDCQHGSIYFGKELNAVACVIAAQKLSKEFPWFKSCVRDIRLLRIEENSDLQPAL